MDKEIKGKEKENQKWCKHKKKYESFPSIIYRAGTEANFDGIYHFTEKKERFI